MKKDAQLVASGKRKHDTLADILVETGMVETKEKETDNNQPSSNTMINFEATRNRVNESSWHHYFETWFWDNTVTLVCQASILPTMPSII